MRTTPADSAAGPSPRAQAERRAVGVPSWTPAAAEPVGSLGWCLACQREKRRRWQEGDRTPWFLSTLWLVDGLGPCCRAGLVPTVPQPRPAS